MVYVSDSFEGLGILTERYRSAWVICESDVEDTGRRVLELLPVPEKGILAFHAGESDKSIGSVEAITSFLLERQADRQCLLVGVGGGVMCDITSFAAALYKRGVDCALIPTTLLAQVDAAIGGKNGVNFGGLKNILGTFREPVFTYANTSVLSTLPRRELMSGAAEMLKAFLIASPDLYESAVEYFSKVADGSTQTCHGTLENLIREAVRIKESIVREDPYEQGRRRVLNLGHTTAHAIEWHQETAGLPQADRLTHGEAVAIGIVHAARLSEQMGLAQAGLAQKIAEDFRSCGLPTELPCPQSDLEEAVPNDKKSLGGKPRYTLIKNIGDIVI